MTMRTTVKILVTLVVMMACGGIAFGVAVSFLMNLGLKLHGNYEYYGGVLGQVFIFGSGALGLAVAAIFVWYMNKNSWRVSLRGLFIGIFVAAALLGIYSLSL